MTTPAQVQTDRAEAAASSMIRELEVRLPKTLCLDVHHNHYWNAERSTMPKHMWTWAIKAVGSDEVLGLIKLEREGKSYYNYCPNKYVLTSVRIPQRRRYKHREGGSRRYKNVTSAIKGIKEFCKPTSNHEAELKQVTKALEKIGNAIKYGVQRFPYGSDQAYRQKRWVEGANSGSCATAITLMASDDPAGREEGMKLQQQLIRAERAKMRYNRRIKVISDPLWERKWELQRLISDEK